MPTSWIRYLFGLTLLASSVQGLEPAEWPRFHGPLVDNRSPDTGLLKEWPKDGPSLALTLTGIGEGYSSPSISGGRLFLTGVEQGKQLLSAFDLEGKRLWQTDNGPGWTAKALWPGVRSTPTVADGRVYVLSGHGRLGCFEAATGKNLWAVSLVDQLGGRVPRWGFSESPLVLGNRVICTPGGPKGALAALDAKTGKVLWQSKECTDLASYCSAMTFSFGGKSHVAVMTAAGAVGVDLDTGALLWQHAHKTSYDVHATPLTFHEGKLYGVSGYGSGGFLLELSKSAKGFEVKPLWVDKMLDDQMGGVVLHEGRIYGSSHSSKARGWVCLDWASGKVEYADKGIGKGALTYADGMLYCTAERTGEVALVHPDPKGFKIASQFKIPADVAPATPFWAHPVVIGGRLYLRFRDTLYVYKIR